MLLLVSYETSKTKSFRSVPYTSQPLPARVKAAVRPEAVVLTLDAE